MKLELLIRLPEILFTIGKVIGSDESLSSTLSTISELVTELTGAQACSVMLADVERSTLLGKAAYGLNRDDISSVSFHFGEGVAGWVAEHGKPALIGNVESDERFVLHRESSTPICAMACVPLLSREHVVGVLTITSNTPESFTNDTLDLLQLIATTIALDIENIRLRRISVTDKLTGAFNREFLDNQLPSSIRESLKKREPLSVIMFDVDHFKDVNDTHGHATGDEVLRLLAKRLKSSSRGRDRLVRYGGEEFLLLLPGASLKTATEIAERIRKQFESRPIALENLNLPIRLSAGVAEHHALESAADLYGRADTALYVAKRNGRNRVEVAD